MFSNVSSFDLLDSTANPGHVGCGGVVGDNVSLIVGTTVPTVVCVILILILIRQNLDSFAGLIGRLNQFVESVNGLFDRIRGHNQAPTHGGDVENQADGVPTPRNLSDSEIIQMRCNRPGEQWI